MPEDQPSTGAATGSGKRLRVVLLSPARAAVSGVSTHANMLFGSTLAQDFELLHFEVGSEGRDESRARALGRLATTPARFAAFLLRERPEVVHINTSTVPRSWWRDLAYHLVARALGRRVIYQVHGGLLPADLFSDRRLSALLRHTLETADVVVVLSEEERRAYQAFSPKIRVALVPNAIPVAPFQAAEARTARLDGPLRLVYVGRLVATKGLFEIVEGLRLALDAGLRASLRVAGSGPDEAALRERIAASKLESHVSLLGPIFGEAKDALWLDSDVFVFPTFHPEGLPYAILESMAAGCVPLTCPKAAIPDVIQDGVHGVFVPPRDAPALAAALLRLDGDRAALWRMAQAGRARVLERYTIPRLAEAFAALYRGEDLRGG